MDLFAPSLLDKLLGGSDPAAANRSTTQRFTVDQVKESVARDIEILLNARPGLDPARLAGFPLAARSLLTFGLTDISSLSVASDRDRARIVDSIRSALARHEPRLSDVEVSVRTATQVGAGLCFSIRARMRLDPEVEPVAFDAVMHPGSHRYAVSRTDPRVLAAAEASAAASA